MDEDAESAMRALQMVDLGTARREHLSTADERNPFSRVTMQQIEARRRANVDPNVKQFVEKDKESIEAWSTLHERIGDTANLEQLNPLMEGQTHRAQLMAAIDDRGGQKYATAPKPSGRSASHISPQEKKRPIGRGRPINQGPRSRSLDPAKNPGLQPPHNPRGQIPKKLHERFSREKRNVPMSPAPSKPSGVKTRRPAEPDASRNFSAKLADPAEFIAACMRARKQSLVAPKQPSGEEPVTGDKAEASGAGPLNPGTDLTASRWAVNDSPAESSEQTSISPPIRDEKQPIQEGTSNETKATAVAASHVTRAFEPLEKEKEDLRSPPLQQIKSSSSDKMSTVSKISSSNLPLPHFKDLEEGEIDEAVEQDDELLLDFNQAPDVKGYSSENDEPAPVLSSSLHELIDLEFKLEESRGSPTPTATKVADIPEVNESAATASVSGTSEVVALKESLHIKLVRYLRELSFLNDTLNNALEHVPADEANELQKRRDFLEKYIAEATSVLQTPIPQGGSPPTPISSAAVATHKSSKEPSHSRDPSRDLLQRAVNVAPFVPRMSSDRLEPGPSTASTTVPRELKSPPPGLNSGSSSSSVASLSIEKRAPIDYALDDLCESLTDRLSLNSGIEIPPASSNVGTGSENVRPGIFSKDPSRTLLASKYATFR